MDKDNNPHEVVKKIAEWISRSHDFGRFLTASDINNALEINPSLNLSLVLEDDQEGNNVRPTEGVQDEFEEPQANSTILDPVEGTVEPSGETVPTAGTSVDKKEKLRLKRKLSRQRRKMTQRLANLSTNPDRQGDQSSAASGSGTQGAEPKTPKTPGTAGATAGKHGRSSPGETPADKRGRKDGDQPGRPSFVEAARKNIVLYITSMDAEENQMRATGGDTT